MLNTLHPLPKLAVCMLAILASLMVFDLGFQAGLLVLAVLGLWLGGNIALWRIAVLLVPFALFGFGFLTTSLLFNVESGYVMQMAQQQGRGRLIEAPGLVLFMRVLACGMISALFVLTTDPGALIRALMRHLRLPAPFGFALLHALHLVPDLGREFVQLRMARAQARGAQPRRIPGPAEVVALAVPLLAFAIRRAGRAALAMETRGLHPGKPRRTMHLDPPPGRRDWGFVALAVLALAALLIGA